MVLKLSVRAQSDLDEIREYTITTWSQDQWFVYYKGLAIVLESIQLDPQSGRDRSLFLAGMRSITYKRHCIFFAPIKAAGDEIVILRIIHQQRYLPALRYVNDVDG